MSGIFVAAADRKMVNIAVLNKSTTPLGADFLAIVNALQKQVSRDFAPSWGIDCSLFVMDSISDDDYWGMIFVDDATVAQALGYHDKTPKGNPIGYVFVKTSLQSGEKPSVTASHELLEILGNPYINNVVRNPRDGVVYAKEACDAVQRVTYDIDGIPVSDFMLPEWFLSSSPPGGKTSFRGATTRPFQIARGGYMPVQKNGQWTQIFGSLEAKQAYEASEHHIRTPKILSQQLPILASLVEAPVMDATLFASSEPTFKARAEGMGLDWSKLIGLVKKHGPVVLDIAEDLLSKGLGVDVIMEALDKLPDFFIDLWHWLNNEAFTASTQPVMYLEAPAALGGALLGPMIQKILEQMIKTQGPLLVNMIIKMLVDSLKGGGAGGLDLSGILQKLLEAFIQSLGSGGSGGSVTPDTNPPGGPPIISVP